MNQRLDSQNLTDSPKRSSKIKISEEPPAGNGPVWISFIRMVQDMVH